MNSSKKGDKLEDAFYEYLIDQQNREDLVYGAYPPANCKIYKKKKYYCKISERLVEFDVVIELYAQGRTEPHFYVVFECKHHKANISQADVNNFSVNLEGTFKHASKGVMVVSSRLQSGAENFARSCKMGIIKYDGHGFEIIADRRGSSFLENSFVKTQIFQNEASVKSLKFSAYHDGKFFADINSFLQSLDSTFTEENETSSRRLNIPYRSVDFIKKSAEKVLKQINYKGVPVNLKEICSMLSIDLQFSDQDVRDTNGTPILGSANFDRKSIQINANGNPHRERFTIAHEIGHFCLNHQKYLSSETIIERDLLINSETKDSFNYERLEFQANRFASYLILPEDFFIAKTAEYRNIIGIKDIGHGYIYVDDQPCNSKDYHSLLSILSEYFQVSKQAVEIKLKSLELVNDQRRRNESSSLSQALGNWTSLRMPDLS